MSIAHRIITWQRQYGRHDLPWQVAINPYRVWVSEIMLQQTQVTTVIPYFQRFMQRFPDLATLAKTPEAEVLNYWSGLGYYRRCKNLHKASQQALTLHDGELPCSPSDLLALPGIGQSTAHAILSIAHNQPYAILDGNVKRVLSRVFNIQDPIDSTATIKHLWSLAQSAMPAHDCRIYTQGMMDLGATICRKQPLCNDCPLQSICQAYGAHSQHTLPQKRPRKKPKRRHLYCLCYLDQGQLFLVKRSDQGIWPSLWCPPMLETLDTELRQAADQFLEPFTHQFTHFTLEITAVILHTQPPQLTDGQWFSQTAVMQSAIPAALRKLIVQQSLFCYG